MNVNLVRNLAQNSKKCNKFAYNVLLQEGTNAPKLLRHNSTMFASSKRNLPAMCVGSPKRCYCQEEGPPPAPSHRLPPLMDFPMVVWPSIFKSLKNLIVTTFIIKPYFDADFNLPDFVSGSKKAAEVVSHRLAEGQTLDGLVTPDIIPRIQDKIAQMSLGQRELIPINYDDVYFSFPYQIGIMFNQESAEVQKRFVEITMVFHVMRGLSRMRSHGEEPPLNMGLLPEYQGKLSICNYRFVKEFTKGVDSDWTVNMLNHHRPVDDEY